MELDLFNWGDDTPIHQSLDLWTPYAIPLPQALAPALRNWRVVQRFFEMLNWRCDACGSDVPKKARCSWG